MNLPTGAPARWIRGAIFVLICGLPVVPAHAAPALPASPALPATRVVTLAPSLAELVFAVGAGDKLVAVSAFTDFPDAARRLPAVADAAGIAWESLLAAKPDLVLAWQGGTRPADIARLGELGVHVIAIGIGNMNDVASALRLIGNLTGRTASAESAAVEFERQLGALRKSGAGKSVVKTFFQISASPLMTINGAHVISELVTLCGGANVFGDARGLVTEPSREELLLRAPDAILYGRSVGEKTGANPDIYRSLPAARAGRIYGVTADYAYRPGPRLILAAVEICAALDRARASSEKKNG